MCNLIEILSSTFPLVPAIAASRILSRFCRASCARRFPSTGSSGSRSLSLSALRFASRTRPAIRHSLTSLRMALIFLESLIYYGTLSLSFIAYIPVLHAFMLTLLIFIAYYSTNHHFFFSSASAHSLQAGR